MRTKYFLLSSFLVVLFSVYTSCKKEAIKSEPVVALLAITNVTVNSASSQGEVTADGGATVISRGICYSATNPTPVTTDGNVSSGAGKGSFTAAISGLLAGTTYYARAYAVNSVGTAYSSQYVFTTLALAPVLTTADLTNLLSTSATSGGNITSDGGDPVLARGVCWSTSENPTIADSKTSDGAGNGTFVSSIANLTPGVTYYVRAYATNIIGTSYGNQVTGKTVAQLPVVTTTSLSNVAATTATSGGAVSSDGGSTVTAKGVCWGTAPSPTIAGSKTSDGTGTGSFTSAITGLTPGMTYYVRAYATNSAGTAYGNEVSTSTKTVLAVVTTADVSSITAVGAASGGSITNDGGSAVTAKGVCWSTSATPTVGNSKTVDGTGTASFTSAITGLAPATDYYVRAYATNSSGTSYGDAVQFTTTASSATLTTTTATAVTSTTASSGGTVANDGGSPVTARGVCWGTTTTPTIALATKTSNGTGTGPFTSSLTGLLPGTTYYVRAYATNSVTTSYGDPITFTTLAIAPTLGATTDVSAVTSTSGASGGTISSDGGSAITVKGVCWSVSTGPTTANSKTTNGTGTATFTSAITGLTGATKYYVRAYATNSIGTSYGAEVYFTTLDPDFAVLTTNTITSIGASSAISGGTFTSDGGATITTRGVCWSTVSGPTTADSKTDNGTGSTTFTSAITGLPALTKYYVRAYAINSAGTAYGNQLSFTTTAAVGATVLTTDATDIQTTSFILGGNVTDQGGSPVSARGVCYTPSSSTLPLATGTHTSNGTGGGIFTSTVTGLSTGTTYYVRAYATNGVTTTYGTLISITTL